MSKKARPAAVSLALLLGACRYQTYQSAFGGAGAENRQFQILFWVFFGVCLFMYTAVIVFLVAGILRRRRTGEANVVDEGNHHETHPLMRSALIGWSALIGVGLAALAIASFVTDRSMANAAAYPQLEIDVTANQWWWDVRYDASDPSKIVRTANELHLPVGVPAHITLHSNDVIHSFWVPSLAGKQDLIPGRETDVTLVPNRIGFFRGQCAEYCGAQHAHMALAVVVDAVPDFLAWRDRQLQPAAAPTTPLTLAGFRYVTTRRCAQCHTIAGTSARGQTGPDLTHLASRSSIAAGTLPMGKANLYGWVANPQALKPGAGMPATGIEPNDLHSVIAYLETLK